MPIHQGQDKNGQFYQWGKTGKKYYFKPEDKQSKQHALNKAKKQQTAIYSSGWKGDSFMKLIRIKKKDTSEQERAAIERLNTAWNNTLEAKSILSRFDATKYNVQINELQKIGQKINSVLGVLKKNNNSVNQ